MKQSELRQMIREEIQHLTENMDTLQKIKDIFSKKLPNFKIRYYVGVDGKTIGFINIDGDESYEFSQKDDENIVVDFYSKKIIHGQSLANTRKNYQTTSAHNFTTKKTKLHKTYNSLDKVVDVFNKFRERTE